MVRGMGLAIMERVYRLSEKFATKKYREGKIACDAFAARTKGRERVCLFDTLAVSLKNELQVNVFS